MTCRALNAVLCDRVAIAVKFARCVREIDEIRYVMARDHTSYISRRYWRCVRGHVVSTCRLWCYSYDEFAQKRDDRRTQWSISGTGIEIGSMTRHAHRVYDIGLGCIRVDTTTQHAQRTRGSACLHYANLCGVLQSDANLDLTKYLSMRDCIALISCCREIYRLVDVRMSLSYHWLRCE